MSAQPRSHPELNITLEEARTLDAVARHQSFSAAAQELHKGHSAVVYSLKSLENKTGLTLLDRSGYRTALTDVGKRILLCSRQLLESEQLLSQLCAELTSGWEPEIQIVFDGIFPFVPIVKALQILQARKIPTQFKVHADFLTGVEDRFNELRATLMISVLPPQKIALHSIPLDPIKAYLVAHKTHPLAAGSKTSLCSTSDLSKHCFLTVRGSDPRLNLSTRLLEQSPAIHLNDFHSKKEAILCGMGFGWLPHYLIEKELKSGALQIISWEKSSEHRFQPHLYYRGEKTLGKARSEFIHLLKK